MVVEECRFAWDEAQRPGYEESRPYAKLAHASLVKQATSHVLHLRVAFRARRRCSVTYHFPSGVFSDRAAALLVCPAARSCNTEIWKRTERGRMLRQRAGDI